MLGGFVSVVVLTDVSNAAGGFAEGAIVGVVLGGFVGVAVGGSSGDIVLSTIGTVVSNGVGASDGIPDGSDVVFSVGITVVGGLVVSGDLVGNMVVSNGSSSPSHTCSPYISRSSPRAPRKIVSVGPRSYSAVHIL